VGISVALITLAAVYSSKTYAIPFLGGCGLYIFVCNILAWLCETEFVYFEGKVLDPRDGPRWKNTDAEGCQSVEGYGTMQTGSRRPGKFDPSMGGCG
jgi:hypothetical protein